MRKLLSIFSIALLYCTFAYGQVGNATVNIPITVADNAGSSAQIYFGLDLAATDDIDPALEGDPLPGAPPPGVYFGAWVLPDFNLCYYDYRAPGITPPGSFPFTGHKSHTIQVQTALGTGGGNPMTISWVLPPQILATSTIQAGTQTVSFSGTGSITFNFNPVNLSFIAVEIDYSNIGPSGPAPIFGIAPPAPLNFGNVAVGLNAQLPVTVTNTGTANLVISGLTSSNPQFTFTPAAPVTIIPGGNQIFNVTFTPTSAGLKTGNLTFTHNAVGSPSVYAVQGTGVEIIDPNTPPGGIVLVNVSSGSTVDTDVIVTNNGTVPLAVTGSITELPNWDILAPATFTIPAGGTHTFTIRFIAPTTPGTYPGTLTFSAPSVPSVTIPLSATVVTVAGLLFASDTVRVFEDDIYTETMQLYGNTGFIHAIQFRLLTNLRVDDNTILTYQSIQKGANVSNPNWVLETNVARGPITANGASKDTIYVLLYNLNPGPGDLGEPNYTDLFRVKYKVARLQPLQNNIKSSFFIFNAQASSFTGAAIPITPSRPEFVVIAKAAGGGYGDVNGDGCVDILDLIKVVDHIVGRDSLDKTIVNGSSEFIRADIAPWTFAIGSVPTPDGVVNVQDLSLIQNIILTGFYPNGEPVAPCGYILPKGNDAADATVTLYINSEGITAYIDAEIGIRGAQIEFSSVSNNPENMIISTPLGEGYYLLAQGLLRTLMYDRAAQKYIDAGVNNFMADMPFTLTNPNDVSVAKIVLVDINTKKIQNITIQTIYGQPTLPLDYILFQNYPNPFNPSTSVKFQVPKTSDVTVKIYDMLGQEVRTLFAGEVMRGTYTVEWDGLSDAGVQMSSGSYIYRMIAGEFMQAKKMVYVK